MADVLRMAREAPEQDSFEAFWDAYPRPRRVQRPLCRAKWEAITNGGLRTRTLDKDSGMYVEIELRATPAEILAGVKRYADMNKRTGTGEFGFKDDGKFICLPATFLNQGRWLDYV